MGLGELGKDHLVFMTSHKGIPCEVWWRTVEHGYGESKGHYWLKVPEEITKSNEVVWMGYTVLTGTLVCPTRPLWGLKVEQDTDLHWENWKYDNHVSGTTNIEITLNGKPVWRGGSFNDLFLAVAFAQAKILELGEIPFDFAEPEKEKGRRVWYYDQPAVVIGYELPGDRLILQYDGPPQVIPGCGIEPRKGFNMLVAYKLTGKDTIPDSWHGSEVVHDSFFSDRLWWYRGEGEICPPRMTGQQ